MRHFYYWTVLYSTW